jgi:hypothetical protein
MFARLSPILGLVGITGASSTIRKARRVTQAICHWWHQERGGSIRTPGCRPAGSRLAGTVRSEVLRARSEALSPPSSRCSHRFQADQSRGGRGRSSGVTGGQGRQERQLQSLPLLGFRQYSQTPLWSSSRGSVATPHRSQIGTGATRSIGLSFTDRSLTGDPGRRASPGVPTVPSLAFKSTSHPLPRIPDTRVAPTCQAGEARCSRRPHLTALLTGKYTAHHGPGISSL